MNTLNSLSTAGRQLLSRRGFLSQTGTSLGSIALASLLQQDRLLAGPAPRIDPARPHAPRQPHFDAKAKNVVVIFCAGGCSQLETFDYKPELTKRDGTHSKGDQLSLFRGQQATWLVRSTISNHTVRPGKWSPIWFRTWGSWSTIFPSFIH